MIKLLLRREHFNQILHLRAETFPGLVDNSVLLVQISDTDAQSE